MSRLACVVLPGVPLHLVQRGAAPLAHGAYLRRLGELACLHRCALHAYALMGNHAHLLLTPAAPDSAPALMHALGGEFDATPIHARRYLIACMRYIEANPVRAGMAARPEDFRWSSYRANALGEPDPLLTPHPAYLALGRGAYAASAASRLSTSAAPRARPGARPRSRGWS
jgi:putative transposase